jgi:hypothetical protein
MSERTKSICPHCGDWAAEKKAKLLKKYSEREPTPFYQFDGFYDCPEGDCVMDPDLDGHCLFGGETWELMRGTGGVRVLVNSGANGREVVSLLQKITELVEWSIRKDGTIRHDTPEERRNELELISAAF